MAKATHKRLGGNSFGVRDNPTEAAHRAESGMINRESVDQAQLDNVTPYSAGFRRIDEAPAMYIGRGVVLRFTDNRGQLALLRVTEDDGWGFRGTFSSYSETNNGLAEDVRTEIRFGYDEVFRAGNIFDFDIYEEYSGNIGTSIVMGEELAMLDLAPQLGEVSHPAGDPFYDDGTGRSLAA